MCGVRSELGREATNCGQSLGHVAVKTVHWPLFGVQVVAGTRHWDAGGGDPILGR